MTDPEAKLERKRELEPKRHAAMLNRQVEDWPKAVAAGKKGNPFATLCLHCYGRHEPPHDDICPYEPPKARA